MRYTINFQLLDEASGRPKDDGAWIDLKADQNGFAAIPSVGDYVRVAADAHGEPEFFGRVADRLFAYAGSHCLVNLLIKVEASAVMDRLLKE